MCDHAMRLCNPSSGKCVYGGIIPNIKTKNTPWVDASNGGTCVIGYVPASHPWDKFKGNKTLNKDTCPSFDKDNAPGCNYKTSFVQMTIKYSANLDFNTQDAKNSFCMSEPLLELFKRRVYSNCINNTDCI